MQTSAEKYECVVAAVVCLFLIMDHYYTNKTFIIYNIILYYNIYLPVWLMSSCILISALGGYYLPFLHGCSQAVKTMQTNLTMINPLPAMTHICVMISHKNLYGGLILGVNTLYRLFCFFKLFPMVGKQLMLQLVIKLIYYSGWHLQN